jgi:uncharacterized SAM-binding protein YcdF (DUF218 family)
VRRLVLWFAVTALTVAMIACVGGYLLFTRPQVDALTKADAIVVLGGAQDGRIDYGMNLAREGYADTVVISNDYGEHDPVIQRACEASNATIQVFCFIPDPWTTRGEAMFVARLARERGWSHVIVVSWNYHMVRARYIFDQCFGGEITMRPVPTDYGSNPLFWAYTYGYQYAAWIKAAILGC